MAKFDQTYPTDLKYTEWQLIMEFFPTYKRADRANGNVANPECDLLCEPYRWPMADAAGGFSALANGVWLLLALETEWTVGSDQCSLGETST